MLAPVLDGGHIEFRRPESRPGDYVEVAAEIDCVVVFSACPDDVYPTNGGDGRAVDAHFTIFDPISGMIFDPISGRETEGGRA